MVIGRKPKRTYSAVKQFLTNFNKKHLWWIVPLVGVFLLVIVQIFWPNNLTRFGVRLAGDDFSFSSEDVLTEKIQKRFAEARAVLNFKGSRQELELSKLGASLDSGFIRGQFFGYSFGERLIPFSLFLGRKIEKLALDFDQATLNNFIDDYSRRHETEFVNATVSLSGEGDIVLKQAVAGSKIAKHRMKILLLGQEYKPGIKPEIAVPFDDKTPSKRADFYSRVIDDIKTIKNSRINFLYNKYDDRNRLVDQKIYTPSRSEFISWMAIDENTERAKLIVSDKFDDYINNINKQLGQSASPDRIRVVDGREVERIAGSPGSRLAIASAKKFIQSIFDRSENSTSFIFEFESIKPGVIKDESYTNSQSGLQAKIEQLGRRYDVRISLKQLNGAGWEAHYRSDESTPSASTYKLYVALKMFAEMAEGRRQWSDQILGKDHRQCFEQMIVASLNECAEEWIRQFGRSNLNQYIYSLGIGKNTTFQSYDATRTTARDLMKTVIGIYHDQFVKGPNRNVLIEAMGRQKWRYGIPAGSKGRVYDKVGFLWNYIHDVAIVEHPRGTYAVAIMTKNASYGAIAQMTRELEAFMYP